MDVLGRYWVKETRSDGEGGRELLLVAQDGEMTRTLVIWIPVGSDALVRGDHLALRSCGASFPAKINTMMIPD